MQQSVGFGPVRDLGYLHGRAAFRPYRRPVVVPERQRRLAAVHAPLDVPGQHAHECMSADLVGASGMDLVHFEA